MGLHTSLFAVCALAATGCGRFNFAPIADDGNGGAEAGALGPFGPAQPLTQINSLQADDDATLSSDLLEIYFDSERNGPVSDIFRATRPNLTAPWTLPAPEMTISSASDEDSPALSADGLTLVVASTRLGASLDLFTATRPDRSSAWSVPVEIVELNSAADDERLSVNGSGLVGVFASSRGGGSGGDDLYAILRLSPGAPWQVVRNLGELNTATDELDPWLDDTGLVMYFARKHAGNINADLYRTTRPSIDALFGPGEPLTELNTTADEADAWLSPDQRTIVFTRGTAGTRDLLMAQR